MTLLSNLPFIFLAIFALGACIFVHEMGHFLAARKRGLKVDRFSIGIGPRIFGWERGGVDYRLSLFPIGGYVSLPQLADMGRLEGGDDDEKAEPLPPISYTDKMIVTVMGAVFNVLFALVLSLVLWGVGREMPVNANSTVIGHVAQQVVASDGSVVPGPAREAGLQPGDRITRVDGQRVNDSMAVFNSIMTGFGIAEDGRRKVDIELVRGEQTLTKTVYPILRTSEAIRDIGISQSSPVVIDRLTAGRPAERAGFMEGDKLVSVDGVPVVSLGFFLDYLSTREGTPMELTVQRGDDLYSAPVAPVRTPEADYPIIGFRPTQITERIHQNPVEQITGMVRTIQQTLTALFHHQSDVKVRNLSGPAGIVHAIHQTAQIGLTQALWLIIFININLAILNLLPIPVLDGGHMVFATIAKIRGKALPRRFLETIQGAFVILLLSFMIYVTVFDVQRIADFYGQSSPPAETAPEPSASDVEDANE